MSQRWFKDKLPTIPGVPVGKQVTFDVTDVATGKTVEIQIDVAIFNNGEVILVDAKFSARTDLTQAVLGNVYTPNQSVVYRWISGGNQSNGDPQGRECSQHGAQGRTSGKGLAED